MGKLEWLSERSKLLAKYSEGIPSICDNVNIKFDRPDSGWIDAHFFVNGGEKGFLEFSDVYEPFEDIRKWLESIVKNESQFKHGVSIAEINCETYGAALYYEPMIMIGDEWNGLNPWGCFDTGIFYVFDGSTKKVWGDAYCKTKDLVKQIYESMVNYAQEMRSVDSFVDDWVWDAYNSEMTPYNENSPELKDFFLKKYLKIK